MAEYGIVKGSEVKINLEGEKKSRVLQVEITDDQDVQSVELYRMPGEDYNPADETRVVVITIGTSKVAIAAADVEAAEDLEKGEREIYSTDGAQRLAKIRLKADGTLVLNDGSETSVRYEKLQTAFDQLKSDHDDLVENFLLHLHLSAAPGSPTATPIDETLAPILILPSTADITPAESETVKLP